MTAKEAKERVLWQTLPSIVTDDIEFAVNQGNMEVVCYLPIRGTSDIINDIRNILEELGYTVSDIDNALRISWD